MARATPRRTPSPPSRAAIELGYRYLETDVHVTADGVLVAFHDDDLQRTCGMPGRISELPWSKVATGKNGTAPIPRLDELLDAWPDARWNIDCKVAGAVAPLARAMSEHKALDRVCVASFSDRRIRALRRTLGSSACTSLAQWELGLLWAFGLRIGHGLAAQVPERDPVGSRW